MHNSDFIRVQLTQAKHHILKIRAMVQDKANKIIKYIL